jgi:histidyl-tRNA synthetase
MIKAVRGTRDLLPPETALWNFVESTVRDVFRAYNFQEIRTPIFESTELFSRSVGEATDIVSKEMYTWEDRQRLKPQELAQIGISATKFPDSIPVTSQRHYVTQSLTLRPENTAGVVRAYIEHNLEVRGLNKLYYIGPQFRRERPQKGRFRQFYQIGAEVIGPPSSGSQRPIRDAEVLEMLANLLNRLGIRDWNLEINSLGDPEDRINYNRALRDAIDPVVGQMCADCQRRAITNPLRIFDCKVPEDQPLIERLPKISNYLNDGAKENFDNVKALLRESGVPFEVNHRLVRGLDYYTRTAFEFTYGKIGAQNALLGGGRYDGLSESLGGPAAPGVGFAMGEDRLILALQQLSPSIPVVPDAFIAPVREGMNRHALKLAGELRRENLRIELGDRSFKLRRLLEIASKIGARYAIIVGENEVASNVFTLKDLANGEQTSVPRADLVAKIRHTSEEK